MKNWGIKHYKNVSQITGQYRLQFYDRYKQIIQEHLSRQSLSIRANGVSLLYIAKDLRSVK